MEPQNPQAMTQAGREMLGRCLQGVTLATRHLDLVRQNGSHAQFQEAMVLWEQAVSQAQEAASTCKGLLDDEVQAWMEA